MDLLFKIATEEEFQIDFKQSLGFIDSDIPLVKIKPDLMSATRTLIKTIGSITYKALITNNLKADTEPTKDKTLDFFAKYAVSTAAYALYAPSNDLGHTPSGRKMRTSDDTKTPFEWMMARDDDNLEKRSFRALDDLLNYMDSHLEEWKESEEFKKVNKLFVRTVDDFDRTYQLGSRLLLLKLQSGMSSCEKREIIPRIGKDVFNDLKTRFIYFATTILEAQEEPTEEPLTDEELLLIELIQDACVYYALSWGLPRLQLNLFPEGVLQSIRGERTTVKGRIAPIGMQVDQVSQLFSIDAAGKFEEIEDLYAALNPPPEPIELTTDQKNIIEFGFDTDDNFVNT